MKRAFWIWNIPNCEGGDPLKIASAAVQAGLTDVFVKVADGQVKFGIYDQVDVVPAVVAALKAVGIEVWGWQYVYGANPVGEEKIATTRIKELGLNRFIVNAEVEYKQAGYASRGETYLSRLKANNPGVTIGFSSYRFPHYHMEFPWATFFKYCDINIPQVYWLEAHNAGSQAQTCIDKFRAMSSMPLILAGPAWKQNGWRPSLAEIQEFEKVAESNGISMVAYWSWEHCRRDLPELWPIQKPEPQGDPDKVRLSRVEQKLTDLEKVLSGLSTVISDLKAIILQP